MKKMMKEFRHSWHGDLTDSLGKMGANMTSLMSFANNYSLILQGVSEQTIDYKYYHAIHKLLALYSVKDENKFMKRMGKDNDGGYIAVADKETLTISDIKIAYSLGISDDVSFDLELAKLGYDVYQYDHTISDIPIHNEKFHWKKIGITGNIETEMLKNLESIITIDGNENRGGMLLKCDIEGSEWDMLMNCKESTLSKFDQMILEFHNITEYKFRKTILEVFEKITKTHKVIHIHANNFASVNYSGSLITPDVMEVTFVNKDKYELEYSDHILPIFLDQPCNNDFGDIILGKWNID